MLFRVRYHQLFAVLGHFHLVVDDVVTVANQQLLVGGSVAILRTYLVRFSCCWRLCRQTTIIISIGISDVGIFVAVLLKITTVRTRIVVSTCHSITTIITVTTIDDRATTAATSVFLSAVLILSFCFPRAFQLGRLEAVYVG
uniref:(northern house mosquito) hypothetical protein n=1 Tax=Culex pipiens TaxID=7175 RepID=A0A8D8NW62_CULPI